MIRKTLLTLLLTFAFVVANAQVARWMIEPQYDSIRMNNIGLFEMHNKGKVGLCDRAGKELLPIEYDTIRPFHEGYAVLYKDEVFHGFANIEGEVVDLSQSGYYLIPEVDYFSCGRLLTYTINKGRRFYRYIDNEAKPCGGTYAEAHPFADGYASVLIFANVNDLDEVAPDMIDVNGTPISFETEKKSNMSFVSSFRNGSAVVVFRNKFYTMTSDNLELQPIYSDSLRSRKSLVLSESPILDISTLHDNKTLIKARNKSAFIFDKHLRLEEYTLGGGARVEVRDPEEEPRAMPKPCFEVCSDGDKYGLVYNGYEVLPPQFDEVTHVEDHFAVVRTNGKYGVLTIEPNSNFEFYLNNNDEIPFRHRQQTVDLKAVLPKCINEAKVISCSDDCVIDGASLDPIDNYEGKFLKYRCTLKIPSDLSNTLTDHSYQFRVEYDGLRSNVFDVHVKEWYNKYYSVSMKSQQFDLASYTDEITIEFDLIKEETIYDHQNYYKVVEVYQIMDDGSQVLLDHHDVNDLHYYFKLSLDKIDRPRINFIIHITETGCPTVKYPFVANFEIPEPVEGEDSDEPRRAKVTVESVKSSSRIINTMPDMIMEVESSIEVVR